MNKLRENEPRFYDTKKVNFELDTKLLNDIKTTRKNSKISQKKLVNNLLKNSLNILKIK